jgi:hypothetical protein
MERALEHERIKRRLTAILMADVFGDSRLMGADDEGTFAQSSPFSRLPRTLVAARRGSTGSRQDGVARSSVAIV